MEIVIDTPQHVEVQKLTTPSLPQGTAAFWTVSDKNIQTKIKQNLSFPDKTQTCSHRKEWEVTDHRSFCERPEVKQRTGEQTHGSINACNGSVLGPVSQASMFGVNVAVLPMFAHGAQIWSASLQQTHLCVHLLLRGHSTRLRTLYGPFQWAL